MMGWKLFKILKSSELGLPEWICKWKMHLSILKGVKFSDFPLCSSSSANCTLDITDTNNTSDKPMVHWGAPD